MAAKLFPFHLASVFLFTAFFIFFASCEVIYIFIFRLFLAVLCATPASLQAVQTEKLSRFLRKKALSKDGKRVRRRQKKSQRQEFSKAGEKKEIQCLLGIISTIRILIHFFLQLRHRIISLPSVVDLTQ